jgi:AsmA protein
MPTSGLKRLGIGVAVSAAAIAGVFAAASMLVRTEGVREAVKVEIRQATGFDPVLGGAISVSPFPVSAVSFSEVSLGDGDATAPLRAERLTARLRILPLLFGRIEVAQITLVEPHIYIDLDAEGQSNWSGLLTALLGTLKPGLPSASTVSFSEIRLLNGTVAVRDSARGVFETLNSVDVSLAWPAISNSFGWTGQFVWRGEKVEASFNLTDFVAALAGDRSGLRMRLASAPLKFAFDGFIGHQPTLKLEGALSADSVSLRRALLWAGQKPLPGAGIGRFAIKAQTSMVGNVIALTGLNVEVDGNAAEGVLTVTGGARPFLQGTLAAEEINITPYLSEVRLQGGTPPGGWSRAPIALEGFSSLDFDLRLSASRVLLGDTRAGRTAVGASLRNGQFALTIGESLAFGGVLKGSLALGKTEEGAALKADMRFTNVDLESCLRALLGVRRLEGRGDLVLGLESAGPNVEALTRTLKGEGMLVAKKGSLTGLNVEQLLRRLERRPLSGTGDFRSGRTPFERLSVGLKIENGHAFVESVEMDANPVRLALGGSASITSRELDLKGVASLAPGATRDTQAFELPFVVRGSWDDPVMLPDVPSLIRRSGAAAPLLDAVRGRNPREAVRSVIDQLTGGDAARSDGAEPPSAPAAAPQQ